jgi:hypothetical protein
MLSRCVFEKTKVDYLDQIISNQEVRVDLKKVEAMQDVTELRKFLKLTINIRNL